MKEKGDANGAEINIKFLMDENKTLRNENLNLQTLIKIQQSKQVIINELVIPQSFQKRQTEINYDIQKQSLMLKNLLMISMEENKRLVYMISSIQQERDIALSKALIHEQISDGLESEELEIIASLNERILGLKAQIQNQVQQNQELWYLHQQKKTSNYQERENQSLFSIENISKIDEKKIAMKVIQLNSMLEKSLQLLNSKEIFIKQIEEQKKELIMINSLLTVELKQLQHQQPKEINLSKIIKDQRKLFDNEDGDSSNYSLLSFSEEVYPDRVNFKIEQNISQQQQKQKSQPQKQELHQEHQQQIQEQQEQQMSSFSNNNTLIIQNCMIEIQVNPTLQMKQINELQVPSGSTIYKKSEVQSVSNNNINKLDRQQMENQKVDQANQKSIEANSSKQIPSPNFNSSNQMIKVPKLDLSKALKLQQLNIQFQQKQEQQKIQLSIEEKIVEKVKALEKKKLEQGLNQEQLIQIQKQILELLQIKKDRSGFYAEENNKLQGELKEAKAHLEQQYYKISLLENHVDQLNRDLADATEKNTTLINSNVMYQNRCNKLQTQYSSFKELYSAYQGNSSSIICSPRNQLFNSLSPNQREKQSSKKQIFIPHLNSPQASTQQSSQAIPGIFYSEQKQQQPFFAKADDLGQQMLEETEGQNTVFVPLSLRKPSLAHEIQQKDISFLNNFNQNQLQLPNDMINDINQAKRHLLFLASDLVFNPNINSIYSPQQKQQEYPQNFQLMSGKKESNHLTTSHKNKNFQKFMKNTLQLTPKRRGINRNRSNSCTQEQVTKENKIQLLPFRCFLKYKNVQPLRIFHTNTMAMHNLNAKRNSKNFLSKTLS